MLLPAAKMVQKVWGFKNPIHPVRVKKAATPTHIIPQVLINMGFRSPYDFLTSLEHWCRVAPEDFVGITDKVSEFESQVTTETASSPVIEPTQEISPTDKELVAK